MELPDRAVHMRLNVGGIRSVMTDALSLLLQRTNASGTEQTRSSQGRKIDVQSGASIELLYGTIILHFNCSLSRAPPRRTIPIEAMLYELFRARS